MGVSNERLGRAERELDAGFEKCGLDALRYAPGRWRLTLLNGRPLGVEARLEDQWLSLEAPLVTCHAAHTASEPWQWLEANNGLPAPAKLWLDGEQTRVRAELRAAGDEPLDCARLSEACRGIVAAARWAEGVSTPSDGARREPSTADAVTPPATLDLDELTDLMAELALRHWQAKERAPNRFSIELGCGAASGSVPASAELELGVGGAVTLAVAVAGAEQRDVTTRTALALYLLDCGRSLRLARAAGEANGAAHFQAGFESTPTAAELDDALGALAVAAQLCAPTVAALANERTSRWYLAAREPRDRVTERQSTTGRATRARGR